MGYPAPALGQAPPGAEPARPTPPTPRPPAGPPHPSRSALASYPAPSLVARAYARARPHQAAPELLAGAEPPGLGAERPGRRFQLGGNLGQLAGNRPGDRRERTRAGADRS